VNGAGSRRKKQSGVEKGVGACGGTENNPAGGRRLWGRRSKLIKPHQSGFEKPVPGKSCKPKVIKVTFAAGDRKGRNVNISV
jgi:hypothetical protein